MVVQCMWEDVFPVRKPRPRGLSFRIIHKSKWLKLGPPNTADTMDLEIRYAAAVTLGPEGSKVKVTDRARKPASFLVASFERLSTLFYFTSAFLTRTRLTRPRQVHTLQGQVHSLPSLQVGTWKSQCQGLAPDNQAQIQVQAPDIQKYTVNVADFGL